MMPTKIFFKTRNFVNFKWIRAKSYMPFGSVVRHDKRQLHIMCNVIQVYLSVVVSRLPFQLTAMY